MSKSGLLAGTAAVVTGGARGLGRTMADALVEAGASVLVADINPDPQLAGHDKLIQIRGDVTQPADAEECVGTCVDRFGRIDVLVNNAGILMRTARARTGIEGRVNFWDVDADTVRLFLDVHAVGSFLMAKAAVPHMMSQGRGRIVTVSTSFSTMLDGNRTPYGPAKAAMEAFASTMSHDLADTGVTVNVLIPGHPRGPHKAEVSGADAERGPDGKRLVPRVPVGIMGPPIVWLASDASNGVTGRRFIATHWDTSLEPDDAAAGASYPLAWAQLDS
ncbi:MAG: SDR family oxidoreductase [Actinobacteria bacterium]|nr:SDR family oxidoreductase [Actinomycetota bacterium]